MGGKEARLDESVIIDIPVELEPDLNTTCWIHKVPRKLRQVNEAAYTPQLVSIGPFHYAKPNLKAMEHHKTKYQHEFWKRDFCKHIGENDIEDFMRQKDRRQRIWDSYAGTFELRHNPDLFFSVILRDALFIFELFLRNFENQKLHKKPEEIKDYILRTPWLRNGIQLDLILLENQLPFFIFTELFDFILQTQPDNQLDMDMPSYLSKLGHQGHWRDQMNRKSHYSFPHFATEFFGNYYRKGGLVLEETMENVDHFQHRFNADVLPSIEETRPQLVGSSLPEQTMENVDHFQHRFNADVLPSIKESRPLVVGCSLLEDTMGNFGDSQQRFNADVLPSIEETRPQLVGSSLPEQTMENVDHFQHRFHADVLPSIKEIRPLVIGSSLLEDTMGNFGDSQHRFSADVLPSIEETRPKLVGGSLPEQTMENVDHCQRRFNADVLPSIKESRPLVVGCSLLEDTVGNFGHSQHRLLAEALVEETIPQLIVDDMIRGPATDFFKNVKHFTDLVRRFLCPTGPMFPLSQPAQPPCCCYSQTNTNVNYNGKEDQSATHTTCFYSAKQLDRAGVSFVPCENQYLTNVVVKRFKCRFFPWKSLELVVPEFKVVDNTEFLMRNVMALEQCVYPFQSYICDYILLLDHLINTAEDVELLVEKRIVNNLLGSNDAVADLVNKLCDQLVVSDSRYGTICKQLNEHHDNFWNVTKAILRRVYFKDLWTSSSSIVAFIVLLFSVVSVIVSIKDMTTW